MHSNRHTYTILASVYISILVSGCWTERDTSPPSPLITHIRPPCKTKKKCDEDIKHYCSSSKGKVVGEDQELNTTIIECEREHAKSAPTR